MENIVVNKDVANVITYRTTNTTIADELYFTVKKTDLPTDYLLQKRLEDVTFEDGTYTIPVSVTDLADISDGVYKYDIELIRGTEKTTVIKGNLTVQSGQYDEYGNRIKHSLEMTRGDTKRFKFRRFDDSGEQITTEPDSMTFIVSKNGDDLIIKDLDDGITLADGVFTVLLEPEDTDGLDLGSYDFGLSVVDLDEPSKLADGTLTLTWEATLPENEV